MGCGAVVKVVFSDESKFNLVGSDGPVWVWAKKGRFLEDRCTKETVKHGGEAT